MFCVNLLLAPVGGISKRPGWTSWFIAPSVTRWRLHVEVGVKILPWTLLRSVQRHHGTCFSALYLQTIWQHLSISWHTFLLTTFTVGLLSVAADRPSHLPPVWKHVYLMSWSVLGGALSCVSSSTSAGSEGQANEGNSFYQNRDLLVAQQGRVWWPRARLKVRPCWTRCLEAAVRVFFQQKQQQIRPDGLNRWRSCHMEPRFTLFHSVNRKTEDTQFCTKQKCKFFVVDCKIVSICL